MRYQLTVLALALVACGPDTDTAVYSYAPTDVQRVGTPSEDAGKAETADDASTNADDASPALDAGAPTVDASPAIDSSTTDSATTNDIGKRCAFDFDCACGVCANRICAYHLLDGVKNYDETRVDCGGMCAPACDP